MIWQDLGGIDFHGWFLHEVGHGVGDELAEFVSRIKSLRNGIAVNDRCFKRALGSESETGLSSGTSGWMAITPTQNAWSDNCYVGDIKDKPEEFGYWICLGQWGNIMLFPPNRYPELQELFDCSASVFEEEIMKGAEVSRPVICLPENRQRRKLLRKLLRDTLKQWQDHHYSAPEVSFMAQILYSIAVLRLLFQDGKVYTRTLSERLRAEYGSAYRPAEFERSCSVVVDYCQTGGDNVSVRLR